MSLNQKHNFTVAHFGLLIGMLRPTLQGRHSAVCCTTLPSSLAESATA